MTDKKKNHKHKDKFDNNINRDGMGTVDNENVSEETGYNRGERNDKANTGEGIEEFIQNEFEDGDNDEDN